MQRYIDIEGRYVEWNNTGEFVCKKITFSHQSRYLIDISRIYNQLRQTLFIRDM